MNVFLPRRIWLTAASAGCLLSFLNSCATPKASDAFSRADTNGDGLLATTELETAMLSGIVRQADADGDGGITLAEWRVAKPGADAALFKKRDLNQDGQIDREEAGKAVEKNDKWRRLLGKFDPDGDGTVSEEELAAMEKKMDATDAPSKVAKLLKIADEK